MITKKYYRWKEKEILDMREEREEWFVLYFGVSTNSNLMPIYRYKIWRGYKYVKSQRSYKLQGLEKPNDMH